MSGIVSTSINPFPADVATPAPEVLRHCGRVQGLLAEIQPAEECVIARVVNRLGERHIVLPQDLDWSSYLGQQIVMMRLDDQYLVRRVGECIAPH
jgi:hypothetical protein